MNGMRGQTLLELMVCLLIAGIMLGIAAPAFVDMLRNNRKAQAVNQLLGGLNYARGEAVLGRRTIGICSGGSTCDGSRIWSDGLLIFDDSNKNGQLDPGENLIRRLELARDATWSWSRFGQQPHLQFEANGTTRAANGTLTLCMDNQPQHQLVISLSGRIRSQPPGNNAPCG
ncbi:GspH/FimT family pseudopilin [Geopseudomonas aromaticivorans]